MTWFSSAGLLPLDPKVPPPPISQRCHRPRTGPFSSWTRSKLKPSELHLPEIDIEMSMAAPVFGYRLHVFYLHRDCPVPAALSVSSVATYSGHIPTVLCVSLVVTCECSDSLLVHSMWYTPGEYSLSRLPQNCSFVSWPSDRLSSWHMPAPQSV